MARPLALVTGASSGIGSAFAERLARDGHDLVIVARRKERLDALKARLEKETGARVEVLVADLADPGALRRVEERAAAELDLLVNNAGFGAYMPFAQLPADRAEELIRVHVIASTRLARAALPGMLARKRGAIVNVASMLAFSASLPPERLPHRATYAGAKAFLVAFTQALAGEVAGSGVKVQVLCPSVVATEFHTIQGADAPPPRAIDPADVVTASLAGLDLGEVVCLPVVEDVELARSVTEAGRAFFTGAPRGGVASRYRRA